MHAKKAAAAAAILLSALPIASAAPPAGPDDAARRKIAAVADGANAFALDLYARLAARDEGNLFLSPASIHTVLAMTYAGARHRTAEQMAATLRFPLEGAELHGTLASVVRLLNDPPKDHTGAGLYELVVANALWGRQGQAFQKEFLALVRSRYGAGVFGVDFAKTEQARKTINDWVARQTRRKIEDLIPPGLLNRDVRLVLTNAIYFKSDWASTFEPRNTSEQDFKLAADKTVRADMMYQKGRFDYMETDAFQAVRLPYRADQLDMLVFLPKKVDGLAALEKALTPKGLAGWVARLARVEVRLSLPKFEFTSQFNLGQLLRAMGMADAFDEAAADFTGMTTAERLFISAVVHKAFVAVAEEGTEAAAATGVVIAPTAMPQPAAQPKVFRADHPFLFLIRHRATGCILFMGRMTNPKP